MPDALQRWTEALDRCPQFPTLVRPRPPSFVFNEGGHGMRHLLLLAILTFATTTAAAEPPAATVTGRKDGKEVSYTYGQDTIGMGLAVAVFGSARLEFAATRERWEAAQRRDHIRVQFARPVTMGTQLVDPEGKRYAADEILVRTRPEDVPAAARDPKAGWGSSDVLLIRCGDKFYSFSKFEGALLRPLVEWFGPSPPANE